MRTPEPRVAVASTWADCGCSSTRIFVDGRLLSHRVTGPCESCSQRILEVLEAEVNHRNAQLTLFQEQPCLTT